MSDFRISLDHARKRLRHKLGLSAALPPAVEPSASSSDGSVSVLHRVLAFEDHQQDPDACNSLDSDIIPPPAALSHSLSGTWKQRIDDSGKPVWQRDPREAETNEVMKETERVLKQFLQQPDAAQECLSLEAEQRLSWERQLLLRLPQVFSLKQAQQQSDALQLQAYRKTRKLQEARFLARQAAEQLLAFQMQQSEAELAQSDARESDTSDAVMQGHVQRLRAAQARMLELSEQVSVAELATEMSEARAKLIELNSGHDAIATPSGGAASLASSSMDDLVPTPSPQGSSQYASSAGSSSCGSSCGRSKANIDRVTTDQHMLSRTQRLQRLSSSLTYDDLPVPPSSEPATPTGDTVNNSLLAPDTPTCFKTPAISGSSGSVDPAVHDTSMDVSCASPDSESTIGRLQAVTGYTFAADAHGEEGSPVLPPLPDLPEQATARAADAQRAINSRRYVHIGCAVACLCVFALWARDASAASFSTRIFPT